MATKCIILVYWNGIKDVCTVKKMHIMIQNLVDPKPQTNENTENIENLACSDPQLITEIKTSHVHCFWDYPTVFNISATCFCPSM
jgi:hypothetical protein